MKVFYMLLVLLTAACADKNLCGKCDEGTYCTEITVTCVAPPCDKKYECRDPCKDKGCKPDESCHLETVQCVKYPCPPLAVCKAAVCELSSDPGTCGEAITRHYYDSPTGLCKTFEYGGCGGNANNFGNLADCRKMCPENPCLNKKCSTGQQCETVVHPCLVAPCPVEAKCTPKDPCKGKCGPDEFCDKDIFCTEEPCGHVCRGKVCTEPQVPGPCRGSLKRYFYDTNNGLCKPFTYGGCEGNDNNFQTIEDCQKLCRANPCEKCGRQKCEVTEVVCAKSPCPPIVKCTDVCVLRKDNGDDECKTKLPGRRFYYNTRARRCLPLRYLGCGGNENNFFTMRDCVNQCGRPRRRGPPRRRGSRRG